MRNLFIYIIIIFFFFFFFFKSADAFQPYEWNYLRYKITKISGGRYFWSFSRWKLWMVETRRLTLTNTIDKFSHPFICNFLSVFFLQHIHTIQPWLTDHSNFSHRIFFFYITIHKNQMIQFDQIIERSMKFLS